MYNGNVNINVGKCSMEMFACVQWNRLAINIYFRICSMEMLASTVWNLYYVHNETVSILSMEKLAYVQQWKCNRCVINVSMHSVEMLASTPWKP